MKKSYLFYSLLLLMSGSVGAQEMGLFVNLRTGESRTFKLQEVETLTFSGEKMLVNANGTEEFTLSAVRNILVKEYEDVAVHHPGNPYEVIITDSEIRFPSLGEERIDVAVYTTHGVPQISHPAWNGSAINISGLPQGIYILTVNDTTFKFKK